MEYFYINKYIYRYIYYTNIQYYLQIRQSFQTMSGSSDRASRSRARGHNPREPFRPGNLVTKIVIVVVV